MNRFNGIIVAVVGLLITGLSAVKVVPLLSTGSALIFLGLLLFGLSFIPKPETGDVPKMSTAETLGAIFYAPGEVFRNLRRHPRWLAVLLVTSIISTVYANAFFYRLTPERITNYTMDKVVQSFNIPPDRVPEMRQQNLEQATNPISRVGQSVNGFVGLVFLIAFISMIFWVFGMVMGGQINYWQAFSSTAYAMFPAATIKYVMSLIILFIKDPDEIHPIIGQTTLLQDNLNFLVNPATNPVIFAVLGGFGLLSLYIVWMNAIGLRDTGERISSTTGWSAAITVWVLGLCVAAISGFFFGNFLS